MAGLKSNFAPMLTFDSMDASGYYYHSSADSSPVMGHSHASSFDSSPGQSPQFYGSFDASASPQYYMESGLEQSPVGLFQSQAFPPQQQQQFFTTSSSNMSNNSSAGNLLLEQPQQQGSQIPGLNELSRLFQMANKVEDKFAIHSKINSLFFEHLPVKVQPKQTQQQMLLQSQQEAQQMNSYMIDSNGHHHQNALITPPLSPNGDNMNMFMSKQNPMFAPLKGLQSCSPNTARSSMLSNGHQVVKVEQLSASMQQQQSLAGRKISQSSFIEAANNSISSADMNSNGGLLLSGGGQSPLEAQNNCTNSKSTTGVYFEPMTPNEGQTFTGQYKMVDNGNSCILVSESTSIPESVVLPMDANQSNCAELKSMMPKPKTAKGKGKGKGKKVSSASSSLSGCDSRQSASSSNGLGHGHPPKQSQKRTAHLSAEFRYRTKLNDKISKLRSLVGQKVHLSKSAVLTRSIERIVKLQKLTIRLHESNLRLQSLVAKYTNTSNNGAAPVQQNVTSLAEKAPLMSIKELTRSLSVGSGTSLHSDRQQQQQMLCPSNQTTIDIDLAKYIDSQMLTEPDHLPETIESTVSSTEPELSTTVSQSLALNSTDEVFDFDQFLDQF